MEVVVTTGAIRRAKLQSNHHHQQTNTKRFSDWMLFLLPNQQRQSTEGKYGFLDSIELKYSRHKCVECWLTETQTAADCWTPRVLAEGQWWLIIIIIINLLIKVTLNEIRCRGTLQSQWSTLTDSTSLKLKRVSMSQMRAGLVGIVAGMEQVILQMTAEGGDRHYCL